MTTFKNFCSHPNPEKETDHSELSSRLEKVLSMLKPKTREILCLRSGLGYDREYTLTEIGEKYGVTRERIRQIETKGLQILRHPSKVSLLQEFLEKTGE